MMALESGQRLAVFQPYFLPYIGYFQLIAAADLFLAYPHVRFSRKSYVDRNQWVENEELTLMRLPLEIPSFGGPIADLRMPNTHWQGPWRKRFVESYRGAPFFEETLLLVDDLMAIDKMDGVDWLLESLRKAMEHMEVQANIQRASGEVYEAIEDEVNAIEVKEARMVRRVQRIAEVHGARTFINSMGGRAFYDKPIFSEHGIQTEFLEVHWGGDERLERLPHRSASILHVLAHLGKDVVGSLLLPESGAYRIHRSHHAG